MYQSVRVVLVKTSHPGNIGAVARAMKNMGFFKLTLVNPKIYPSDIAFQRSSGAHDILDQARVVDTIDEALEGCHVVVGASARSRKITWPVMNPRDCASRIKQITQSPVLEHGDENVVDQHSHEVAILFGQENNGLSNDELQRCHYHVHIPSNPSFGSLNLAMAVQVILYELRMCDLLTETSVLSPQVVPVLSSVDQGWDVEAAPVEDVERMLNHFADVMEAMDFYDPENPRQLMTRLRRLFQRAHLDKMEVNILRGFLNSVMTRHKSS
jgi:tRNA (cytidine32/uridine32-2'-O)-methyltransferase